MKYIVDIKLIGFETVYVQAKSDEEALEKALERFWEIYSVAPAQSLRWKETTSVILEG